MAEYIEKEALLLRIDIHGTNKFGMLDEDIREFIKEQPAADVAPVRHCRWVLVKKNPDDMDIYRCPWCGRIIATIFVESKVAKQFPYCHCGTKMDGGETDA